MDRANALRDLIACIETGVREPEPAVVIRCIPAELDYVRKELWCIRYASAVGGSLDAVAHLEAPLRERGWCGPFTGQNERGVAWSEWWSPEPESARLGSEIKGTEPRARLLAVLQAMLHEEQFATASQPSQPETPEGALSA